MDNTLASAADRIALKAIRLELSYPDHPAKVMADSEKLKIALLNIIINAIEAVPKESGKISISIKEEAPFHKVLITDNGGGIPEENLSRIFEPYFTSKTNGFGLGLAATWNILQSHRASIEVSSQNGEGTSFIPDFRAGRTVKFRTRLIPVQAIPGTYLLVPQCPRNLSYYTSFSKVLLWNNKGTTKEALMPTIRMIAVSSALNSALSTGSSIGTAPVNPPDAKRPSAGQTPPYGSGRPFRELFRKPSHRPFRPARISRINAKDQGRDVDDIGRNKIRVAPVRRGCRPGIRS